MIVKIHIRVNHSMHIYTTESHMRVLEPRGGPLLSLSPYDGLLGPKVGQRTKRNGTALPPTDNDGIQERKTPQRLRPSIR